MKRLLVDYDVKAIEEEGYYKCYSADVWILDGDTKEVLSHEEDRGTTPSAAFQLAVEFAFSNLKIEKVTS